jgi:uncharacterized protein (TIGR02452 family)
MIKTLSTKMTTSKAKHIAEETLAAIQSQKYTTPSGRTLSLDKLINPAVRKSKLYKPDWRFDDSTLGETIFNGIENVQPGINTSPIITVTRESTLQAGARLADENACFLNFASAKHPGGGFLSGSLAQEESIARSSALYHTLVVHPEFYEENKRSQSRDIGLYLDYAIYSPKVPVLRNDDGEWLEEPYFMSILTSPAPNKNAILQDLGPAFVEHPDDAMKQKLMDIEVKIAVTFRNRMKQVLEIMADNGHRTIVLGSWGSGAFGQNPYLVSELFKEALIKCPYFDNVIFAIYDSPDSENLKAYIKCFS